MLLPHIGTVCMDRHDRLVASVYRQYRWQAGLDLEQVVQQGQVPRDVASIGLSQSPTLIQPDLQMGAVAQWAQVPVV